MDIINLAFNDRSIVWYNSGTLYNKNKYHLLLLITKFSCHEKKMNFLKQRYFQVRYYNMKTDIIKFIYN